VSLRRYAAAPAHRHAKRTPWLILAIVTALGAAVLALAGPSIAPKEARRATDRPVTALPSAPRLAEQRPSATRRGAIEAAVAALRALAVPALTDRRGFERSLRRIVADGREGSVRSAFGVQDEGLRERLTGSVVRAAPLGYRLEHFDGRAAAVSIWTVTLAAGPRLRPRSSWRRITVDLVWERGEWKIAGGAGGAAPSPSSAGRAVVAEAGSYRELRHGP
jgi:hypothetical protein